MLSYKSWIGLDLNPMYSLYIDSGTREKIRPKWRSHHLGKIRPHILHCIGSYAMHIPPLCS
jgi:hypothetical protein